MTFILEKQTSAVIPNIIHSLDANHLINSAENLKFGPIITGQDCFGTHPNKLVELIELVTK
jgi:DNA-directed RNA polymerase